MTGLVCAVALCMVYATIVPAIALENTEAEKSGHRHTQECYTQVTTLVKRIPVCHPENPVLHHHDEACYDENGNLWCTLPEKELHQHSDSCYAQPEIHTHTEECYIRERGEQTCTEHVHTEQCQRQVSELICGQEEGEEHSHDEGCYETHTVMDCGVDSAHQHTDECFGWEESLSCDFPADPEGEPVLICQQEEILAHQHGSDCYDGEGNLICGKPELQAHQHTGECFETAEEPVDTEILTCPLPEDETHTHSALCYGTWERTCGLEETTATEDITGGSSEETPPDEETPSDDETLPEDETLYLAEQAIGSNWMALRDSGWFEAYSGCVYSPTPAVWNPTPMHAAVPMRLSRAASPPSDIQVDDRGGANSSDGVSVSKTIEGTDLENVFDITLQVQTSLDVSELISEPDIAVVIVMDISNTMKSNFGSSTRYKAAMDAAQMFLNTFGSSNSLGVSKVGFVAFNTDAHRIFDLQSCSTQGQADALTNIMRTGTGNIINNYATDSQGNVTDVARFTNIEAGLAMAWDMLRGVSNQNKYIIFLSDGFPTTYIENGYRGYNPYNDDTTNYGTTRFYDRVLDRKCRYGTSYSDTAAILAGEKAERIKESGITIFSVGVDVAGQKIQTYIDQSERAPDFSVVDRTKTTYAIGDATSTESYKIWLREKIGSGYYYDSTNSEGLSSAFHQIFQTIKEQVIAGSRAEWVAADPMPTEAPIEFIGFYNQTPELVGGALTGSFTPGGENTAAYDSSQRSIRWDLKHSGYQSDTQDNLTTYTYQLVYRVRLCNEQANFREADASGSVIYPTNGNTQLNYRVLEEVNGVTTVSDPKTIAFPIPSVHGFVSELTFQKVDNNDQPLQGAEFTLTHDDSCGICRGNGTPVAIASVTAAADEAGTVTFAHIPSGHRYALTETKVPEGYSTMGITYGVEVAYDAITVTVSDPGDSDAQWNGKIVNFFYYALPNTGGAGIVPYTFGGFALMTAAAFLLLDDRGRRGKEDSQAPETDPL